MTERMTTMAGITVVLTYGVSRGLDLKALCERVGLDATHFGDPLRMIPFSLTRRVWLTLIDLLPEENIGVGVGTAARSEHMGYAGLFLNQVRNGRELIQLLIDSAPIGDTALVADPVTVREHDDRVEVCLPALLSAGIPERTEAAFLMMLSNLQRLGLEDLWPVEVRAAHAYSQKRAIAEKYYRCRITWSAGEDVMCFERAPLYRPLPNAHPRAADDFRAFVADEVGRRNPKSFPERVLELLKQQVLHANVSQHETASALGMSVRSLQRKLSEHGLHYGDMLGQAMESRASELMRVDAYSLEDIAVKLGYSELSSFSRFWKRLTGQTPARYRARLRGKSVSS